MYKTMEYARERAKEVLARYPGQKIVLMERKLTKRAVYIFYGFRFLINEEFNSEWKEDDDHSYSRMIEVIQ